MAQSGRGAARGVRGLRSDRPSIQLAETAQSCCPDRPAGNYRPDMGLQIGASRVRESTAERSGRASTRGSACSSDLAAPFAPLHYALIGERLDYRPNAFFDPDTFRGHTGCRARRGRRLARVPISPGPSRTHPPRPPNSTTAGTYRRSRIGPRATAPSLSCTFLEPRIDARGRRRGPTSMLEFVRDITRGVKPRSGLEEAALPGLRPHAHLRRDPDPLESAAIAGPPGPLLRRWAAAHQEREVGKPENATVLVFVQCAPGNLTQPYLDRAAQL